MGVIQRRFGVQTRYPTEKQSTGRGPVYFCGNQLMRDLVAISSIDRKLLRIIGPIIRQMGYDLVRLRYGGSKTRTLQIMAERQGGGMEVTDCAEISRAVSSALDVEDPVREGYTLEVSSPGIDRPLTRLADFEAWNGHLARIETELPVDGRRRFRGQIGQVSGEHIRIVTPEGEVELAFDSLASARLVMTDQLLEAARSGDNGPEMAEPTDNTSPPKGKQP